MLQTSTKAANRNIENRSENLNMEATDEVRRKGPKIESYLRKNLPKKAKKHPKNSNTVTW